MALLEELKDGRGAYGTFKVHMKVLVEMMYCRIIDRFLCYLADLMYEVFLERPETMKSDEKVSFEEVLSYGGIDELSRALAERKVDQLAYGGVRMIVKYFESHYGIRLFDEGAEMDRAIELVEVRNILVHNRGIVNKTFLSRVQGDAFSLGDQIVTDAARLMDKIEFLMSRASAADSLARSKFGLPSFKAEADESGSGESSPPARRVW